MSTPTEAKMLAFVTCVSRLDVFERRLMASPCLRGDDWPLSAHWNCSSAAQAFNGAMQTGASGAQWLVWVHQDVFLPEGWDSRFVQALQQAQMQFPSMAVAGVYGLTGAGAAARRAGHVLDRGKLLQESATLPCAVDSLDELLFAVRVGSGLQLDERLCFDFYATDLVLQAQQAGMQSVVLDAYCEHWSDTPAAGPVAVPLARRISQSAQVFEHKWAHRLPLSTPCFDIKQAGDVDAFIRALGSRQQ